MDKELKLVVTAAACIIIAPVVINIATAAVNATCSLFGSMRERMKFKKDLKNGRVVKIDGQYYEVELVEEA